MSEGYGERGRKALAAARSAAKRYHADAIGPEHLLLGLLAQRSSTAVAILGVLQVEAPELCDDLEERLQAGEAVAGNGQLPFTPGTKVVLEHALEAAQGFGHERVGTEHLLLGLVMAEEGVAAEVLQEHIQPDDLRELVARRIRE